MTTLGLDADYNFIDGENYTLLNGCDEVAQNVRTCLSLFPGESFVFPDAGLDWFAPAMRSENFAASIIRTKLSSIEGVDVINGLTFDVSGDRFANILANITVDSELLEVAV